MQNPEWLQQTLFIFEARTDPFTEVAVAESIRSAKNTQAEFDDASWPAFRAEHSAFMFLEKAEEDSPWGTFFAPMAEWSSDDGRILQPDIAGLDSETVRHWETRCDQTKNSIFRARYADCIWDLERKISRAKRQHKYAIVAICSYIETAKRGGYADSSIGLTALNRALSIEGVNGLARAVSIAKSINNNEMMKEAASELISFCAHYGTPAHAGVWLAPFDVLYSRKNVLSPEQTRQVVEDLEKMLHRIASPENGSDFNPFGAQAAAERLSKYYNDARQTKRLVQAYGSAFEYIAHGASPMLATAWMQPVIEKYQQVGLKAEAERLAMIAAEKGERIKEDLRTYEVELTINQKSLEDSVDVLLAGDDLSETLSRIGREFIPSASQARESLNHARENTPLVILIRQDIVTSEGRVVAQIGSIDDDAEGRLQKQIADHISIMQRVLSHVFSELKIRKAPTAEQIIDALYKSPLFSKSRRAFLFEGVNAYLNEDWVKAIHVLIPQMEQVLRNLMVSINVPDTKIGKNSLGGNDLKNMGDVLGDERVQTVLQESLWRYLTVLYSDRRGLNLRNRFAHGLLGYEELSSYTADLIVHSFLCMSLFRKEEKDDNA